MVQVLRHGFLPSLASKCLENDTKPKSDPRIFLPLPILGVFPTIPTEVPILVEVKVVICVQRELGELVMGHPRGKLQGERWVFQKPVKRVFWPQMELKFVGMDCIGLVRQIWVILGWPLPQLGTELLGGLFL